MYKDLVIYAENVLDILTKKYEEGEHKLAYFPLLAGIGSCRVESNPDAGHNYYAVIDAIHKYYTKTENKNVKSALQDSLLEMISVSNTDESMDLILNILIYQIQLEDDEKAVVFLDRNTIIDDLRNKLKDSKFSVTKRKHKDLFSRHGIEL